MKLGDGFLRITEIYFTVPQEYVKQQSEIVILVRFIQKIIVDGFSFGKDTLFMLAFAGIQMNPKYFPGMILSHGHDGCLRQFEMLETD